jgi:hypothetical protein
MKPIYLVRIIEDEECDEYFEIPSQKTPKTIGRAQADFITTNDETISRPQIEIQYVANEIRIKQLGKNPTYAGTRKNPQEIILDQPRQVETLKFGNIITMGNTNYQLKVKSYQNMKELLEKQKLKETARIKDIE